MASRFQRERRSAVTARFALALAATAFVAGGVVLASALGAKQPAPVPVYPNVVEEVPSHLQIQNDHQKEWLRFSTTHINLGPGNLQIRGGGQIAPCTIDGIDYEQCTVATQEVLDSAGNVALTHPAGVAFFHPEHNHWHQSAVAAFKIATGDPASPGGCSQTACGTEIAAGVKIIFASSTSSSPASPARRRRLCRGATSSATAIFRASRPAGPTSTTNRRPCRSSR
jgi:hypothetical protein